MMAIIHSSDLDNFMITGFVAITAIMYLLNRMILKLQSKTSEISSFLEIEIEDQLDNYIFNFENKGTALKTFSLKTKLIASVISLVIIALPLYEMIETLKPMEAFYAFSCLL